MRNVQCYCTTVHYVQQCCRNVGTLIMNNMLQTRRRDLVDELQEASLHARYCGLSVSTKELLLLASLFLLELSIMLMPMAIYMKGERSFAIFLTSKPGMVFQGAIVVLFAAGAFIGYQYWVSKRSRSSHFRLIVMMNLVTVTLTLVAAELTVRFSSQSSKEGETFGNTILLPKNWHYTIVSCSIKHPVPFLS